MGIKKFTVDGEVVEENQYYKVVKPESKNYYIFSKYDDTYWTCVDYKIVGAGLLRTLDNGDKLYSNHINMQTFGQGRTLFHTLEINKWKELNIDGKIVTVLEYFDEKGYKFIRCLDEKGSFYKPTKKIKFEDKQEENLTV